MTKKPRTLATPPSPTPPAEPAKPVEEMSIEALRKRVTELETENRRLLSIASAWKDRAEYLRTGALPNL